MTIASKTAGPGVRIGYAFLGLLAGYVIGILVYLSYGLIWSYVQHDIGPMGFLTCRRWSS